MRLLIDGRTYGNTGIGVYLQSLCVHLDSQNDFDVILILQSKDRAHSKFKRIQVVTDDTKLYSIREQLQFLRVLKNFSFELAHFPHFNVPIFFNRPFVFTFHDLTTLRYFDRNPNPLLRLKTHAKLSLQRPVMQHAVREALTIFVPTEWVKKDIEDVFPKSRGKIVVTKEGPGHTYPKGVLPSGVKKPYILYVGNISIHKNLDFVVRNWSEVTEVAPEAQLVLAGRGRRDGLEEMARSKELPVIFPGYVNDDQLGALYAGAAAFIFPSLSEGFGLPPLEAMQNGTPVISSSASCMPEVLGDAALYFNPTNPEEMAGQITRVLTDHELAEDLRKKGYEQVKKYSWQKMAEETVAVYKEVLEARARS